MVDLSKTPCDPKWADIVPDHVTFAADLAGSIVRDQKRHQKRPNHVPPPVALVPRRVQYSPPPKKKWEDVIDLLVPWLQKKANNYKKIPEETVGSEW